MMHFLLIIISSYLFPAAATETQIFAFAGSTSSTSVNKRLARQAAELAKELGAQVSWIDLKDYPMPFYDADLEAAQGMPENVKRIRNMMIQSQAIIISSPEYNGSIPAVLKNLIDWTSRSENGRPSQDAFKGKIFAIMSASPGRSGGARGLIHLQTILENLGGTVALKKVSLSNAYEEGAFENPSLKIELQEEIKEIFASKRS